MQFIISLALMFGVMYFLLIRPQKKQQEKVQNMLDNLQVGDSIITIGGLHGIIDKIDSTAKTVDIDCEGIYLTFERRSVSKVVSKASDVNSTTEDIIVEASEDDEEEE